MPIETSSIVVAVCCVGVPHSIHTIAYIIVLHLLSAIQDVLHFSNYGMSYISHTPQSRTASVQRVSFEFVLLEQELFSPEEAQNCALTLFGAVLPHLDLMMEKNN